VSGDNSNVEIQLKAKNLTQEAFDKVAQALKALEDQQDKTTQKGNAFAKYLDDLDPRANTAHASFQNLKSTLDGLWEHPTSAVQEFASALTTDLGGALGGAATAVGLFAAGVAAAGVVAFELAEKAASIGANLNDMSEKTGIAVPQLSRFSNALQVAGSDVNTMSNAVFMMQKNMAEDGPKFQAGMQRINLSIDEFKQLSPDQQFLAVAEGLKHTTDPSERAAAAMEIFGRQGRDLIPTLMKLGDALEKTNDIQPWTEEQARAAEQFEMQMTALKLHVEDVGISLGRDLIPAASLTVDVLARMGLAVVHVADLGGLVSGTYHLVTGALGETALATAQAAEEQNRITEAHRLGAPEGIKYGDAVKYITDKYRELHPESVDATADADAWLKKLSENAEKAMKVAAAEDHLRDSLAARGIVMGQVTDYASQVQAQYEKRLKETEAAAKKAAEAHDRFVQSVRSLTSDAVGAMKGMGAYGFLINDLSERSGAFRETLYNLDATQNEFHDGLTVAGDTISTVTIPLFAKLATGAVPQMTGAIDDARDQTFSLSDAFTDMEKNLRHLAQVSGASWGGMAQDIAIFVETLKVARDSQAQFETAKDKGDKGGMIAGLASEYGPAIGAGASADTSQGFNHSMTSGIFGNSTQSATAAVALGVGTMGISIGVSAAIAGLKYLFRDRTVEDVARDGGEHFGTVFSQATTDAIKKDIKSGLSEQGAEIFHLGDILKDAGGLTEKNLPQMTARLHDVFSMIETHQLTIAQGTKVIDDNWQQFAAAGTDADGRLSASLKEIIDLDRRVGTESKEITQYLQKEGDAAEGAFNAIAAGMLDVNGNLKVYDDLKKKVDDAQKSGHGLEDALHAQHDAAEAAKGGLADLGTQAVATYAAAVASGKTETQALAAIHPALQSIRQAYSDLGLDIDDAALKELEFRDNLTTAAPQLVNAIGGLSTEMVTLDNMGAMNAKTFEAMERTGQSMWEKLRDKVHELGGTDEEALGQMQSYLHQAKTEAELLGVPLDDNTQKLIDMSKDAGIWHDDTKSKTEDLTTTMGHLVDKIGELVDKLGGVHKAVDDLPTQKTIKINYDAPDTPDGPYPMAGGGDFLVTKPTLFLAGEAGTERASFSGAGRTSLPGGDTSALEREMRDTRTMMGKALTEIRRTLAAQPTMLRDAMLLTGAGR
jgi:hypothetical protein